LSLEANKENNFAYFPVETKPIKRLDKYQLFFLIVMLISMMIFITITIFRLLDNSLYFEHLFLRIGFILSISLMSISLIILLMPTRFIKK